MQEIGSLQGFGSIQEVGTMKEDSEPSAEYTD